MTINMIAVIVIFACCILYVLSTRCRCGASRLGSFYGWKYAHRGLHGKGIPENSMGAFRRARDCGYGVELDVHLMADGNLAVIHDSDLLRTTGKEGRIEDLATDDLQQYCLEGTAETIPTFVDVLAMFEGRVPLIVELKTAGNNHAELCQRACAVLDNYDGIFCLESFDPRCIHWLKKNRPDLIRGQLTENFFKSKTSKLPWILKLLMTNQMLNFLTLPDFVAYKFSDRQHISDKIVRLLWKTPSVTWTILSQNELDIAVSENRVPIFEGFEP